MSIDGDRTLAETALRELEQLRKSSLGVISNTVIAIAHTVQPMSSAHFSSDKAADQAQGEAWLAICTLANKLAEDPDAGKRVMDWDKAIAGVRTWLNAIS